VAGRRDAVDGDEADLRVRRRRVAEGVGHEEADPDDDGGAGLDGGLDVLRVVGRRARFDDRRLDAARGGGSEEPLVGGAVEGAVVDAAEVGDEGDPERCPAGRRRWTRRRGRLRRSFVRGDRGGGGIEHRAARPGDEGQGQEDGWAPMTARGEVAGSGGRPDRGVHRGSRFGDGAEDTPPGGHGPVRLRRCEPAPPPAR